MMKMINKKYELIESDTPGFFRVKALRDFGEAKTGDIGGYVESEKNLSQDGDCWIFDVAKVYGNALVFDDARVYGNAIVYGNALVFGKAQVYGNALVFGVARVYDKARVFGNAMVSGNARVYGDAVVSKFFPQTIRSDGYTFIYVPCADGVDRIIAGCRYMDVEEYRQHVKGYNNVSKELETLHIIQSLVTQQEILNYGA